MLPKELVFTYDSDTRSCTKNQTNSISSVRYDGDYAHVTFKNGRKYRYNASNVDVYPLIEAVDVSVHSVRVDGYDSSDIVELGEYENCYAIICKDSKMPKYVNRLDVSVRKAKNKELFTYFKKIAAIPSSSDLLDKDGNPLLLLLKELEKISLDSCGKTVLSSYLSGELISRDGEIEAIYPFSINTSQKQALEKAFSNNISVIQGPPGTGKTQTILNIIANIVIQGKTVGVISNNNAAVDNVIEKLEKYGYGFLVARLGNGDNQNSFFGVANPDKTQSEEQSEELINHSGIPVQLDSSWKKKKRHIKRVRKELSKLQTSIDKFLDDQILLSQRRAELIRLQKEFEHFLDGGKPTQSENAAIAKLASKKANWLTDIKTEVSNLALLKMQHEGLMWRIRLSFRTMQAKIKYGKAFTALYETPSLDDLRYLDYLVYTKLIDNCEKDIDRLEKAVEGYDLGKLLARSEELSKIIFNDYLYTRNESVINEEFDKKTYQSRFDEFSWKFPIITSTTHSIQSSVGDNVLDYIIIDESSQVDIVTASLAFAKCKNVIVVGDSRQLPHIVGEKEGEAKAITESMGISAEYDYVQNNIIDSLQAVYGDKLPSTLLREHYRCNPIIIEYCNRKYYNGELVVMTQGGAAYDKDSFPMRLVRTKENSSSCRDNTNTRQAAVIKEEILPWYGAERYADIGIVAPYGNQVRHISGNVCAGTDVEVDTIHKFQGREKDIIIFSTVKRADTIFLDDPNLINVAVSRAKEQFILVAQEGYELRHGSNIGDLIRYIRYFNPYGEYESKIVSVFDLLHKEYSNSIERYKKRHPKDFEHLSEDYMNNLINEVISEGGYTGITVCHNYPLRHFIHNHESLSEREIKFATHACSHVDFLLVNSCDNSPILAIEVDGGTHREKPEQQERDAVKNSVLKKNDIHLLRLPTNGHGEKEKLATILKAFITVSD